MALPPKPIIIRYGGKVKRIYNELYLDSKLNFIK